MKTNTAAKVSVGLLMLAALLGTARAGELSLQVQGVASEQGEVMVAVFAGPESWLRKPAAVARQAAATRNGETVTLLIKDLPEGPLALSVFQDLNGNGRLDTNAMGVPKEPIGFSNNAAGAFGPPRFEQARFELKPGVAGQQSVKLN